MIYGAETGPLNTLAAAQTKIETSMLKTHIGTEKNIWVRKKDHGHRRD